MSGTALRPRLLVVMNEGRYLTFAPLLNRLMREGLIEDWVGASQEVRAKMEPLILPEDKARILFHQEEANPFPTYAAGQDYFHSIGARMPSFDMGWIFSAEKYPERHYPNGLRDMAHTFRFLKALRDERKLNMAFGDYPASAMDMMLDGLMREISGRTFYFTSSRVGVNLLYVDSLAGPKVDVRIGYRKFRESLSQPDREAAKAYLADFLEHKRKPYYFSAKAGKNGVAARFARAWKHGGLGHPIASTAKFLAGRRLEAVQREVPFSPIDPADRIIFHPLQYLPEASTYVRAPMFRDHVAVANQLALCIPPGHTLYIKDHPLLKARRDADFYRRILQFPNVKLVGYQTDTHEVIRASKLTVTQSSTAGFESLLYGLPVLLLGGADIFYQDFKGVLKLGDLPLKAGIAKALELKVEDQDKYPMILAILRAGYPGKMDDPRNDPEVIGPANMENLYVFVKAKLAQG